MLSVEPVSKLHWATYWLFNRVSTEAVGEEGFRGILITGFPFIRFGCIGDRLWTRIDTVFSTRYRF